VDELAGLGRGRLALRGVLLGALDRLFFGHLQPPPCTGGGCKNRADAYVAAASS
jgi:hypothetical protein